MNKDNTKDVNGRPDRNLTDCSDPELPETEELEGGFVRDLDEPDESAPRFEERKYRAKTASYLAFLLVAILVLTLVLHYIATLILSCYKQAETVQVLGEIFDKWLPVITGFVGGAVTYYFTKEKS